LPVDEPAIMAALDGRVLAINNESDSITVVKSFIEAKADSSLTEISLHALRIDQSTVSALIELLRFARREWDAVEFINCRGRVEIAITSTFAVDRVKTLSLVRNIEMGGGYRALGTGLQATTSLKTLRLTSTIGTEDAMALAEGLTRNMTLELLEFRWCLFEDNGLIELTKGLNRNKHLKKLDFFGCSLEDGDIADIASSLQHHPTLEALILNGNKCGESANQRIAALLESPTCVLRILDVSFQRLDNGHRFEASTIISALKKNESLHTIDMTNNGLTDPEAELFADILCENTTLQELFLARNKIADPGIAALASRLPKMKGLKKLSLWGNKFGEEGAHLLLSGMIDNMELDDLDTFRQFKCSDQIQHFTNVNRGGRKLLQESTNNVPLALWSLALDRANRVKLTKQRGQSADHARADIIFCLLHGPALLARL
jgi:Ran GTPase-activating protein (RanGAP) involved in mRNA processing and transport